MSIWTGPPHRERESVWGIDCCPCLRQLPVLWVQPEAVSAIAGKTGWTRRPSVRKCSSMRQERAKERNNHLFFPVGTLTKGKNSGNMKPTKRNAEKRKLFFQFPVKESGRHRLKAPAAGGRRDTASEQPPNTGNRQRPAGWRRYEPQEGFCFDKSRIPGGTAVHYACPRCGAGGFCFYGRRKSFL